MGAKTKTDPLLATAVIPGLPQSVNHMWRQGGKGRVYKTRAAKEWHEIAVWHLRAGRIANKVYNSSVKVDIVLYMRTKRRADIDNRAKQCLDSLSDAGIIVDDSQVCEMSIKRVQGAKDETEITIYTV